MEQSATAPETLPEAPPEASKALPEVCCTEKVWKEHNSTYESLFVLCLGQLKANASNNDKPTAPLLDVSSYPWNSLKGKCFKPANKHLIKEIERRVEQFELKPKPRPNQWPSSRLLKWLNEHPIKGDVDCKFLAETVQKKEALIRAAANETTRETTTEEVAVGKSWNGDIPYLRLIHCIVDDTIKPKFLRRNVPKTRQEIDARNSPIRESTVYEDIASLWNSKEFNPESFMTSCHESFTEVKDLSYAAIADFSIANQRKVQDKIANIRRELLEIIKNWEQSGQGDGGIGYDSDDDDIVDSPTAGFGRLSNRPRRALDSRSAFLRNKPPYLLYFWELADEQGLLSSTLQRLDDGVGVSDGASTVSLLSSNNSRKEKKSKPRVNNSDDDALNNLSRSIFAASQVNSASEACQANRKRVHELEDQARSYRMKIFDANNASNIEYKQFLETELETINKEIDSLNENSRVYEEQLSKYGDRN